MNKFGIYETKATTSEDAKEDILLEEIQAEGDDTALLQKIEFRLGEAKLLHDRVVKRCDENMKLFRGKLEEVAGLELSKYNSQALLNRFFLIIRNMVGMDTDNMPIVEILPAKDQPKSVKKAEKVKAAIEYGMLRVGFLDKITQALFDCRIKTDAYLHWFWNYDTNDFDMELVTQEELSISPDAEDIQSAEYLIYHPLRNRTYYKNNYPDFYDQIKFEQITANNLMEKGLDLISTGGRGNVAREFNYWENDFLVKAVRNKEGELMILEKKQNPYFEYRDPLTQIAHWAREARPEAVMAAEKSGVPLEQVLDPSDIESFKPITNFLSEPRKPFVQIPSLKLAKQFYSEDLFAQGKETLLSYVNKKRQIADNLRGCNKKVVVDSNSFSEEEAAAITDEPLQVLRADMSQNPNPVQIIESSAPELNALLADMEHDEKYLDDLFGQHDVSRGRAGANTLGQDQMNRESDRVPVRFQSRQLESGIRELFEGWIQLIKMFYTETHYIKKLGAKEGMEIIELINHEVEEGIEPLIKPGSMVRINKYDRAMMLWNAQSLDPYSFMVEMDMPDPQEKCNRLINWIKFGLISEEDPEEIAADMQNQATSGGDMTENPIERAHTENKAFQGGSDVPPTPPELVNKEHVKLHYDFYKDPEKKMEKEDMDRLYAHAEVDKATLAKLMAEGHLEAARQRVISKKAKQEMEKESKKLNSKENAV